MWEYAAILGCLGCVLPSLASYHADPPGFAWGTATASYQVEGGAQDGGRGPSIWDLYSRSQDPSGTNYTAKGENGDVSDDHYHRFRSDIELMADLGVNHYRLSLSWSRIFPTGRPPVNPAGVQFYNDLIDGLLAKGIEPLVTLYHWDLPLALDGENMGWLNPAIEEDFLAYADFAFATFGDRVKLWLTFNEPFSFCVGGYGAGGNQAPARCSDRSKCAEGNDATEPYICSHNVLRAHGAAMEIYRNKHAAQKGRIGITINSNNGQAWSNSSADLAARERFLAWQVGWYGDPAFLGDYPEVMKTAVGDRLPTFTAAEKARFLANIPDFYGLNHYTSSWVKSCIGEPGCVPGASVSADQQITTSVIGPDGTPIGPPAASPWLQVVPHGIRYNLIYIAARYASVKPEYKGLGPPIFVTENGCDVPGETELPLDQALNDTFRVDYYQAYTTEMMKAVHEHSVDVRGYFAWSLMDNFEWSSGFELRFGIHYVDYDEQCGHPQFTARGKGNCTRYPKQSAHWLQHRIQQQGQVLN